MKDFLSHIESNPETKAKIDTLRGEVESFARNFPMPGFDNHWMRTWNILVQFFPSPCHACHATDFMEKRAADRFRELKSFKIVNNETKTRLIYIIKDNGCYKNCLAAFFLKLNWKVLSTKEWKFYVSAMEMLVLHDYRVFGHLGRDVLIHVLYSKTSRKRLLT